jgi:hypothetical protein
MWHELQNWALGIGVVLLGVSVATVLTAGAIAVLMLRDLSAPVGPMPATPSPRAAARERPWDPAQAKQPLHDEAPMDPAAEYQESNDPTADRISESGVTRSEAAPAPRPFVPRESEGAPQRAIGQGVLALRTEPRGRGGVERTPAPSRSTPTRALETVDPREFLRQADLPK